MRWKAFIGLLGVLILFFAVFSFQGEKAVGSNGTLILYNSAGIGIVEKTLELNLKEGINDAPLNELAGLDIGEITIRPLDDGVHVLGIFSRSGNGSVYGAGIGGQVEIKLKTGDTISGKFLGMKDGRLAVQGAEYYLINPNEVTYFRVKELDGKPGVYMAVSADKAGKYRFDVIYRVNGMSWSSRYKLYIGNRADLYGYMILDNPTAETFRDAKVLLVAGDVNLIRGGMPNPVALYEKAASGTGVVQPSEPQKVEAFYLYKLGTVDLNPSSKMMYPYITQKVPFEREYLYKSWPRSGEGPVYESISFKTKEVLPAGVVEMYRETENGALLIGERTLEHTAKGETVRIGIGRDYDLKGTTKILQEKRGSGYAYYKVQITVENFGNETKTVVVRHYKRGKITGSSLDPIDETADYVEFKLTVGPGEKKEVVFEYENRW